MLALFTHMGRNSEEHRRVVTAVELQDGSLKGWLTQPATASPEMQQAG